MTLPDRTVHMLCNAHLDPVWLWEWEEGAATTLSTFRTAATLCEQFPNFIFNHNEVILYRWVEEYDPALFKRIQALVKAGRWHIMGGWYLQPDCNMPAGESFVRQILLGRRYFSEKFGVKPTTAINFDPFGHTRGLVQILVKSGFDSYIVCRPSVEDSRTPGDEFIWEGYDGSQVIVTRPFGWYNSPLGQARQKAENFIANGPQTPSALMLWGVGDHGGGPSHKDVADLEALIDSLKASASPVSLIHSTGEAYFASLAERAGELPRHARDMNAWAVGCYTSMVRVKQKHRLLENELYATEKMASAAWSLGLLPYPGAELQEALIDLATCEFHDILPGSSIQPAEEMALRILDHGLEQIARVKARTFFALSREQPAAAEGDIPVLVYNPHPFPVKTVVECEFNLADFKFGDSFTDIQVFQGEQPCPTQVEKELGNLNLDWRKRVAFTATLAPAQMNRFEARSRPTPLERRFSQAFHFETHDLEVTINPRTGLIDLYRVRHPQDQRWLTLLDQNAFAPLVMRDNPDPWGMLVRRYRDLLGAFMLLSPEESQRFSGVVNPGLAAVRVIEDGDVRTVIEAVMGYGDSRLVMRYMLPKQGSEIEVEVRVFWNEKDRMLKLSIPTLDKHATYRGQVAYGVDDLPANGDEVVAQKWVAVVSVASNTALTIINDGLYGSDFSYGEARLSLLRSPGYSAHPIVDRPLLPLDRFSPRIDQGERLYRFWINAGPAAERLEAVDREALAHNEKPMALSIFPAGLNHPDGEKTSQPAFVILTDVTEDGREVNPGATQLAALKKAEAEQALIVRLFNPTPAPRLARVQLPSLGEAKDVSLQAFELRSFMVKPGEWREVDLVETPVD